MLMLLIILGLLFGWMPALCGVILKLFGVQDITVLHFSAEIFTGKMALAEMDTFRITKKNIIEKGSYHTSNYWSDYFLWNTYTLFKVLKYK